MDRKGDGKSRKKEKNDDMEEKTGKEEVKGGKKTNYTKKPQNRRELSAVSLR